MHDDMYGFDRDKLGLGARSRARDLRRSLVDDRGRTQRGPVNAPLRDPQWDAYFQILGEQGVDEVQDASVGIMGRNKRIQNMPASIYSLLGMGAGRSF